MIWVLLIVIIALALHISSLRSKLKALELRHDTGKTPTEDLVAWLDLVTLEWLLLDCRWRLRKDGLSKAQVAAIKAERAAMTKAFHERDARREWPVMKRPLVEGPSELKDLYDEQRVRGWELDELERQERHPALYG
jgi:hypothetical protein